MKIMTRWLRRHSNTVIFYGIISIWVILLGTLTALASGCVSPEVKYVRDKNPQCEITELPSTSGTVKVRIECPGALPKTREIRRQH